MRILLVEPAAGGHHFSAYVRFALRGIFERGWDAILLTSREAMQHPSFGMLQEEFGTRLRCLEMPEIRGSRIAGRSGLVARQLGYWKALRSGAGAAAKRETFDCILLMSLDGADKAIALAGSPFGNVPLFGISIGLNHHWPEAGISPPRMKFRINLWFTRRLLSRSQVRGVMSIDPTLLECSGGLSPGARAKLFKIPDPGDVESMPQPQARKELGIDQDAFAILVYGEIALRKSIATLLACWKLLEEPLRGRVKVILAGQCRPEARQLLDSDSGRPLRAAGALIVLDRYIDKRLEGIVFAAADAVWCAYSPEFLKPSAVLSQAASAGRPVIGCRTGLIGRIVERNGIGPVVDSRAPEECARAIRSLAGNHDLYHDYRRRSRSYGRKCSASAFGNAVCSTLEQGMKA